MEESLFYFDGEPDVEFTVGVEDETAISKELHEMIDAILSYSPEDKKYDVYASTYGSEFELADVPRSKPLPPGLTWDGKDQTVMNTNGVATDPSLDSKVRTWDFGGEMNTKPCKSIDEIVALYQSLLEMYPETAVNNSCNLHNHMRIPGLDLEGLKRLTAYYAKYREELVEYGDPIPHAEHQGFTPFNTTPENYKMVVDRVKHHVAPSKGTRHGALEAYVLAFKLEAPTEREFHAASCYDKLGSQTRSWAIASRAGLNTLQMRKSDKKEHDGIHWDDRPYAESGTIEFRMHHGTVDIEKYRNTLIWDTEVANAALNTGETPASIYGRLFGDAPHDSVLPEYQPVEPEKMKIFKLTKNDGSNARRDEVRANIAQLKAEGKI